MKACQILTGDCREVLPTLPDKSIHCVVTSPPYWGLRDYGTSTWEGGSSDCDHKHKTEHQKQGATSARKGRANVEAQRNENFIATCKRCGAERVDKGIGLERTFDAHLENLVAVFREVRRVLRDDGTLWVNYGDAYSSHDPGGYRQGEHLNPGGRQAKKGSGRNRAGSYRPMGLKPKDLMMMPARVAMALQADGAVDVRAMRTIERIRNELVDEYRAEDEVFPAHVRRVLDRLAEEYAQAKGDSWWLRSEIIWHKPNPMPESCTDRPTSSHEKLFLLTKSARYFYDAEAVRVHRTHESMARDQRANLTGPHVPPGAVEHSGITAGGRGRGEIDPTTRANLRNVWTIPTHSFKEAHFATFPPKLVEPCIKAGTSERGVCGECGAPWKRQVDKELIRGSSAPTPERGVESNDQGQNRARDGHVGGGSRNKVTTTGWAPTCEHTAETVPATVLDPFAGSGTTGHVALSLGRHFIGIEINGEYTDMGRRRILGPLFADEG